MAVPQPFFQYLVELHLSSRRPRFFFKPLLDVKGLQSLDSSCQVCAEPCLCHKMHQSIADAWRCAAWLGRSLTSAKPCNTVILALTRSVLKSADCQRVRHLRCALQRTGLDMDKMIVCQPNTCLCCCPADALLMIYIGFVSCSGRGLDVGKITLCQPDGGEMVVILALCPCTGWI